MTGGIIANWSMMTADPFKTRKTINVGSSQYIYYSLRQLEAAGLTQLDRLPVSIRILLEMVLRNCNQRDVLEQDVRNLAAWQPAASERPSFPFKPGRVLLQDFTGVPAIVDLAAMRDAMAKLGGDPKRINPL